MKSKLVLLVIMLLGVALASCNDTTPITMQNYEAKLKKLKLNSKVKKAEIPKEDGIIALTIELRASSSISEEEVLDDIIAVLKTLEPIAKPVATQSDRIFFIFYIQDKGKRGILVAALIPTRDLASIDFEHFSHADLKAFACAIGGLDISIDNKDRCHRSIRR